MVTALRSADTSIRRRPRCEGPPRRARGERDSPLGQLGWMRWAEGGRMHALVRAEMGVASALTSASRRGARGRPARSKIASVMPRKFPVARVVEGADFE